MQDDILNVILPKRGEHRPQGLPIWEEDRQMFIMDDRESKGGHRSYKGIRGNDSIMTIEYVGNYHTLTYINAVEIYVNDGSTLKLAGKREFPKQIYDKALICSAFEELLASYLQSQSLMLRRPMGKDAAKECAHQMVASTYVSMTQVNTAHMVELAQPLLQTKNDYYLEC